jgi:hypothetical protein
MPTRVTVDAYFGNLVARPVGVVHQFNAASSDGTVCVFGINPSNSQVFAIADNKSTSALAAEAAVATVGSSTTFVSSRIDSSYVCDGSAATMPLMTGASLMSNPNRVGLFARSVSASFDWAMVVTSPP